MVLAGFRAGDSKASRQLSSTMVPAAGAPALLTHDSRSCTQVTTHVVAANANTEKVVTALRQGKKVVGPEWVQACLFRWERVPEADHPAPQSKSKGSSAGGGPSAGGGGGAAGAGGAVDELAMALRAAGGGGQSS